MCIAFHNASRFTLKILTCHTPLLVPEKTVTELLIMAKAKM